METLREKLRHYLIDYQEKTPVSPGESLGERRSNVVRSWYCGWLS
jgi:hypothetical protein